MAGPVHVGRRQERLNVFWNKTGTIGKVAGSIAFVLAVFWFWYAWFGSVPHKALFVRWDDISHSGTSRFVGEDQLLFLHGGTLARYNLKTKQKVWSVDLVTQQQVDDYLKAEDEESTEVQHKYGHGTGAALEIPSLRKKHARIDLEEANTLHGTGQNIWVANGTNVMHYDWNSGNLVQTIALTNEFERLVEHGDELWATARAEDGSQDITRISMADGSLQTSEIANLPGKEEMAERAARRRHGVDPESGLPLSPTGEDKPLNPQKVQQQVQNMPLANRIALPATLAGSQHQRQINNELKQDDTSDEDRRKALKEQAQHFTDLRNFELIPDGDSYIAISAEMRKENIVENEAMKPAPKTSIISSGNLSTANEDQAINEQLNEMQRNNGGDKVEEDQSRYQVAILRPDTSQPDWIGQVTGSPQLFPLKSVNVLTAGKTVTVFDKSNKILWKADLTYSVSGGGPSEFSEGSSRYGDGPCVEHDGTLYVFDQAVLTSYDLNNGTVHWRIPSVGVVGLFFDDKGMLYVNTTTGNPDDIKYSRQIDIGKKTDAVVIKVDPKTGKTLWSTKPEGYICYVSGPYIYACQAYDVGDEDEQLSDGMPTIDTSYIRILRVNPGNGRIMWDHEEGRAPVDVEFDRNTISVVLKKEVEVLHYFSF